MVDSDLLPLSRCPKDDSTMQVPKGGNGVRIKFALYIRASGRTIVSSLRRSWNVWGTGRNGGTAANHSINQRTTYFGDDMVDKGLYSILLK